MKHTNGMAMLCGELPFNDADAAIDKVLATTSKAPSWPQLPTLHWLDATGGQFTEGLPGRSEDDLAERVGLSLKDIDPHIIDEYYEQAERAVSVRDYRSYSVSPSIAAGLYKALEQFPSGRERSEFVKVQLTGPVTAGLRILDENDKPVFYDQTLLDLLTLALSMKSRWMIRRFKHYGESTLCFLNEPILHGLFKKKDTRLPKNEVVVRLRQVIDAIHDESAFAGIHICGETDWTVVFEAKADVLSYDAYAYGESILPFAGLLKAHIDFGGAIAFGIVPNSPAIREETVETLTQKLKALFDKLANRGLEKQTLYEHTILTTSCGLGLLSPTDAERAMFTLKTLSETFQL